MIHIPWAYTAVAIWICAAYAFGIGLGWFMRGRRDR